MTADPFLSSEAQAAKWRARRADGSMSETDEVEFERWLAADPENASRYEQACRTWTVVGEYATAPELLAMRVEALRGARDAQARRGRRHGPGVRAGAAAAAAAVILSLAGGVWFTTRPLSLETSVGERRTTRLKDGSTVVLDAGSRVRVKLDRDERQVWLDQGRARFDVARDARRPFTVRSGDELVTATGTAFTVERLGERIRVVLHEGGVVVREPASRGEPERERRLTPGHALVADAARRNPASDALDTVDPARETAWEDGLLVFDGESLEAALIRINRYADAPVEISGPRASAPVHGVFRAGDTLGFIEGVAALNGWTYVQERGGWTVRTGVPSDPGEDR